MRRSEYRLFLGYLQLLKNDNIAATYTQTFCCMLQERWKVTAEQAKAESTQRGLEEERRSFNMQINMEREELERAKVRLTNIR